MIYNLGIYFYGGLIKLASTWSKKAQKWVNGRKNFWENLPTIPKDKHVVWFHCASMGEYDQGLPVMEKYKELFPDTYLLVTFFSPSGYEVLKDKSIGDHTCYLPLDTPENARKFVDHFQPERAFFVKYEYWLNYIDASAKKGCDIYGLSAVFRENQRFFKWYAGRFKSMINKFDHFFLQNKDSADILAKHGYSHYTVTGDTRYDRVLKRAEQNHSNSILESWYVDNSDILIVGSSWPKDEQIIIPLINKKEIDIPVIIAPHEVNKEHIDSINKSLQVPHQNYTDIENGEELKKDTKVIILNCIGVLAKAYKYGTIAYVGGGFGTGLHNILEPAAFGLPVIFGPQHDKFPETEEFIDEGVGKSISDNKSFISALHTFNEKEDIESKVTKFVQQKGGATDKVLTYFK